MNHAYNSDAASRAYQDFLASEDGKLFRQILGREFTRALLANQSTHTDSTSTILDAGCGDGWLAGLLSEQFPSAKIHACDAGEPLITTAKQTYPQVQFSVCDLNQPLPYENNMFDVACASMVLHDVSDEAATLTNIAHTLKPNGTLYASIVNPYYGYPVGEWKRGIVGRLLGQKPKLRLARAYNVLAREARPNFEWREHLGSHFTPLAAHMTTARTAGLVVSNITDITSTADSDTYNLTYQLHRFPIILLLEFKKT